MVFFSIFTSWVSKYSQDKVQKRLQEKYIERIEARLEIEYQINDKYFEEGLEHFDFSVDEIEVKSKKIKDRIEVIISNSSIPSFEYVIMDDESVIYSILED